MSLKKLLQNFFELAFIRIGSKRDFGFQEINDCVSGARWMLSHAGLTVLKCLPPATIGEKDCYLCARFVPTIGQRLVAEHFPPCQKPRKKEKCTHPTLLNKKHVV
jgi:hypothetical protein